ncbi:MAG: RHS repeat-associated core domain-containing protein [Candidatus Dormibacteria bacterium]
MSKTVNGTAEQYAWDESGSLPLLLEDGSTDFIYGPGGLTLEQLSGTTADYFLHDWQGSTMGLASQVGALAATDTYDAYGNLTSSSGTATTPLLFQGQYLDSETGLYYLQSRYYAPSTGQFLSRDPGSALVPYAYAVGDPINASDPSGQMISRGTVGSVSGPTVLAPPPATNQAAYYHQVNQETTYHAPAPVAPQVSASVPAGSTLYQGSAPVTSVSPAAAIAGVVAGVVSLPGAGKSAQAVASNASAYIRAGGKGVYLRGVAGEADMAEGVARALGPLGMGVSFIADVESGSSPAEAGVQTVAGIGTGVLVGGAVGSVCEGTFGVVTFGLGSIACMGAGALTGGAVSWATQTVIGFVWSHFP